MQQYLNSKTGRLVWRSDDWKVEDGFGVVVPHLTLDAKDDLRLQRRMAKQAARRQAARDAAGYALPTSFMTPNLETHDAPRVITDASLALHRPGYRVSDAAWAPRRVPDISPYKPDPDVDFAGRRSKAYQAEIVRASNAWRSMAAAAPAASQNDFSPDEILAAQRLAWLLKIAEPSRGGLSSQTRQ